MGDYRGCKLLFLFSHRYHPSGELIEYCSCRCMDNGDSFLYVAYPVRLFSCRCLAYQNSAWGRHCGSVMDSIPQTKHTQTHAVTTTIIDYSISSISKGCCCGNGEGHNDRRASCDGSLDGGLPNDVMMLLGGGNTAAWFGSDANLCIVNKSDRCCRRTSMPVSDVDNILASSSSSTVSWSGKVGAVAMLSGRCGGWSSCCCCCGGGG